MAGLVVRGRQQVDTTMRLSHLQWVGETEEGDPRRARGTREAQKMNRRKRGRGGETG